jgi:hypothetical protein
VPAATPPRRFPLDGAVVPALLLLIARDLALFDPPRELAWPLFHEFKDAAIPAWLAPWLPHPEATLFNDPVGLILATAATGLAAAYLLAAIFDARPRVRGALLALAALVLVLVPTAWAVGLGVASGRPYGHDGGVVQLPLALEKVAAGESPYGADYSHSELGEQSRSSTFWQPLGGNPIVRHHWYLPGMHLVMAPFFILGRALFGGFDPRVVTSLAFILAAWLAARFPSSAEGRLTAAALILINPFVYWAQAFGTNDVLSAVPLLAAALLARRSRPTLAALTLGLACAVKQLAWPFAPFLIVELAGITSFREAFSRAGLRRLFRLLGLTLASAIAIVAPVAALDPGAFVADIFRYQTGSPGSDQYPLGGTPGFGVANLLIYSGAVHQLSDYYPFQRFYVLLIPLGLLLLRFQFRRPGLPAAFVAGSVALLASVFLSRIPNPNYLILATLFLPLALLLDDKLPADLAVVPLALLALASEAALRQPLRSAWETGSFGLPAWLSPSPAGPRWHDPLSLGWSGLAATLALGYLVAVLAGAARPARQALVAIAALLVLGLPLRALTQSDASSGVLHARHAWITEVVGARDTPGPGAWGERPGVVRTRVVEAWPGSWRKDPPRPLPETEASPGAFAVGRWLRTLRWDPRVFVALASLAAAVIAASLAPPAARPAVLGAGLLAPPTIDGVLFGGGDALTLLLMAFALALAERGRRGLSCALLGAAGATSVGVWAGTPAVSGARLGAALAFGAGFLALGAPLVLGFPGAFWDLLVATPTSRPGVGLSNVFYYRPDLPASWLPMLRWACLPGLLGLGVALWRAVRRGASEAAVLATGLTVTAFLWPGTEAAALFPPLVLLALAATGR